MKDGDIKGREREERRMGGDGGRNKRKGREEMGRGREKSGKGRRGSGEEGEREDVQKKEGTIYRIFSITFKSIYPSIYLPIYLYLSCVLFSSDVCLAFIPL